MIPDVQRLRDQAHQRPPHCAAILVRRTLDAPNPPQAPRQNVTRDPPTRDAQLLPDQRLLVGSPAILDHQTQPVQGHSLLQPLHRRAIQDLWTLTARNRTDQAARTLQLLIYRHCQPPVCVPHGT